MTQLKQKQLKQEIKSIKNELEKMAIVRPGSLSKQYNVCGKSGCACKDKDNPKKHGPYYVLSYRHRGKNRTEFIRKPFVGDVKEWVGNYQKLRDVIDKWIDCSIELSKMEMKEAYDRDE